MAVRDEDAALVGPTVGSRTAAQGELAVTNAAHGAADIAARSNRLSLTIQNVGTKACVILTSTADNNGIILQAGAAASDGTGGAVELTDYVGSVWLYTSDPAGTSVRYVEVYGP